MKKRLEKKATGTRVFGMPLGVSTIKAIKQRALDEDRTMASVCTEALLDYLAKPTARAQRSA